jgi:hypothetical protein
MKAVKITTALVLLLGTLHAELSVANIEKMVEDIKAKRTSKMKEDVNITSPFILVRQEDNSTIKTFEPAAVKPIQFTLGAIMNNAAFIDGAWHHQGDEIDGFRVEAIGPDKVTLKQGDHTVVLYFKKTKSILTFSKE